MTSSQLSPNRQWTAVSVLAAATLLLAGVASAQYMAELNTSMAMQGELNQMQVGPGGVGNIAMNRARGVAGQGGPGAYYDPDEAYYGGPGGQPMDPMSAYGGAPGYAPGPGYGQDPYATAPGGAFDPAASAQEEIPMITVIYGVRYYDVTEVRDPNDPTVLNLDDSAILGDAKELSIQAIFKDDYYDDGLSGLDYEEGDGIYTNVTIDAEHMAPEKHLVKTRLIRALELASDLNPLQFSGRTVASSDPLANVPHTLDLEAKQDDKLEIWAQRFLREFRVNPDSIGEADSWDFHPTFMPPPPKPLDLQLPANFYPPFVNFDLENPAEQPELGPDGMPLGAGGLGDLMGTNYIPRGGAAMGGSYY